MSEPLAKLDLYATQIFAKGQETESPSDGIEALRARLIDNDARQAEALSYIRDYHPVEKLRVLLMRGRLKDAELLIDKLPPFSPPDAEQIDLQLEIARLRTYQGRWTEALSTLQQAEQLNPSLVSRMALHQIRALSFFENGAFESSLRELDVLDSLGSFLPYSQTFFYGKILRAKVYARIQQPAIAHEILRNLWESLGKSKIGIKDRVLTLLRAELDFLRVQGRYSAELPALCFLLAEQIGDDLFQALALVDIAYSVNDQLHAGFRGTIQDLRNRFERVDLLLREVHEEVPHRSMSAKAIALGKEASRNDEKPREIENLLAASSLWIERSNVLINLKPFRVMKLGSKPKLVVALKALSAKPHTRAELFSKTHCERKFVPHLHDSVMYVLLSRLRNELGLRVVTENQRARIKELLIHD